MTSGPATPVTPTGRCLLALSDEPHPCVGHKEAVVLAVRRAGLERISGCVLHAALMLASAPPSQVFVASMPPARMRHAVAALELARMIAAGEAEMVSMDAYAMCVAYVGGPPW